MDLLQQSAKAWKEIIEYCYLFTYGYKKQLYPIKLTFSLEDYPHLAGFQYTKDISLPNYSWCKLALWIYMVDMEVVLKVCPRIKNRKHYKDISCSIFCL